jgi:O-antigen ligase
MFVLPSQSTTAIFTYLLGVVMLFQIRRWQPYLKEPLIVLSGILLGYLCLSSFWSEPVVLDKARSMFVRALSTFLFLIAFAECWRAGYLQRYLARALLLPGTGAALVAIGYFLITQPDDGRMNGLGQLGAHVIAGLMFGVLLIVLLQTLRLDHSSLWRGFAVFAGFCFVTALVLTFSRNAWISSISGMLVFMAASNLRSRKQFLFVLGGLLALGMTAGWLLLATESGREWLLPRGDSFRPLIWSTIFDRVWLQQPVFGLGILTPDDVVNGDFIHPHPHSMYLSVLYQGGLVGLGLFAALISLVVREFWQRFNEPASALALGVLTVGLASYLLDGHELVDRIGETWMLFWLPVAFSLALRSPPTREPSAYPTLPDPS